MTMGHAFDAFARQVANGVARIEDTLPRLFRLSQGGTAVGTGLNAPPGFDVAFCEEVSLLSGLDFSVNPCKFEGMAAHDALAEVSGALNVVAISLVKIANDIRLLGSGPRCGLGELVVPHDGLTSSIMPGKRNPTIAEVLAQTAFQVAGNNVTVTMACAAGTFELNVAKPVIVYNVLQSIRILADTCRIFSGRLIRDLAVDRARLAANVANSLLLATCLNPVLGYDKVAQITARALEDGSTPREAALSLGLLSGEEYDRLTDARQMLG
jgi:fumarate hydratase class II